MDSIFSTVLSIFQNNPIIVLVIVGYIVFPFLKSSKNDEANEHTDSGSEKTWEDMEREYGISIERKIDEPSVDDVSDHNDGYRLPDSKMSYKQSTEKPKKEQLKKQDEHKLSTSKAVAVSSLIERLAEVKLQKTMEEGKSLSNAISAHTNPAMKKACKSRHDIKEGMKWAFIFEKPKALRHRAR